MEKLSVYVEDQSDMSESSPDNSSSSPDSQQMEPETQPQAPQQSVGEMIEATQDQAMVERQEESIMQQQLQQQHIQCEQEAQEHASPQFIEPAEHQQLYEPQPAVYEKIEAIYEQVQEEQVPSQPVKVAEQVTFASAQPITVAAEDEEQVVVASAPIAAQPILEGVVQDEPNSNTLSAVDEDELNAVASCAIPTSASQAEAAREAQCQQQQHQIETIEEQQIDQPMPETVNCNAKITNTEYRECSPVKEAVVEVEQNEVVVENPLIVMPQKSPDQQEDAYHGDQVEREMVSFAQQSYENEPIVQDTVGGHDLETEKQIIQEATLPQAKEDDPMGRAQVQSEDSDELDHKLLHEQASDQDFSDEENQKGADDDGAFEEGSEDMDMIQVTNPILFTEHVPVIGRVPLMFFLPDVDESEKLQQLIEAHGGRCIEQYECSSFQIRPQSKKELDFNHFYKGDVYDEQWIKDSITGGVLQRRDMYYLMKNDCDQALKLNISKRKKITIVEGMKLYKTLGAQKFEKVNAETYKGLERQGYLPERSIDTMKNFWKEYSLKQLEIYLVEAIFYKWDYCLSFKEIPNEEFEFKHRQQFAQEFNQLEALEYQNDYERQGDGGIGSMTYDGNIMDDISEDSDDIFNDKVTQRIDELNKSEAKKFAALDTLTSPGHFDPASLSEQGTGITKASTGLTNESGKTVQTTMIDTCAGGTTNAFNSGNLGPSGEKQLIDLSDLIADGTANPTQVAQAQQPVKANLPQMKRVSLRHLSSAGFKRTYSQASALCLTTKSRPMNTLDQVSVQMKLRRFKRYTPQEREYPAYEPWELAKQMDIEMMSIRVNEASIKEHQNKMIPRHYRTVARREDVEGKFKWLSIELEEIAKQYSRSMDEIMDLFEQVNCDKRKLRERLEGTSTCTWKKIEDLTLKNYCEALKHSKSGNVRSSEVAQYRCLVDEKGLEEITARCKFLGFDLS